MLPRFLKYVCPKKRALSLIKVLLVLIRKGVEALNKQLQDLYNINYQKVKSYRNNRQIMQISTGLDLRTMFV